MATPTHYTLPTITGYFHDYQDDVEWKQYVREECPAFCDACVGANKMRKGGTGRKRGGAVFRALTPN